MKNRLLAAIFTLAMIFLMLTLGISAAGGGPYTYKFTIHTLDEYLAGTDSEIRAGVKYYDGDIDRDHCDLSGDDFYRNQTRTYTFSFSKQDPWMVQYVHAVNKGKDAWGVDTIKFYAPTVASPSSPKELVTLNFKGSWLENSDRNVDCSSYTKRNFTSLGTFDNWAQTIYLGKNDSGTLSKSWNANTTDQYGTYNPFKYDDPATFSLTTQTNASSTNLFTSKFTPPSASSSASLSVSYADIYNEMKNKGIGKVTLNFKLSVPARSSNAGSLFTTSGSNLVHTETVTIYRKCFDIGNASYSATPVFNARTGYDYLNSAKREVTITVSPTSLHCVSSISDADIKTIVSNFKCTPTLCKGNGSSDVITNLTYAPSSDGKQIVFKGTVPADYTTNGAGLTLHLDNVSTTYGGTKYDLNSGLATKDFYFSSLKVDTVNPTVSITDSEGTPINVANNIAQSHTFYVSGSETLYKSNTAPHPTADEAYTNYSLYSGGSKVSVTNYNGGTGSYLNVTVPVSTATMADLPITLKTASSAEGVYSLVFDGYDDAGNPISNATVENVLLDSLAPRYTLVSGRSYQDAQKVKHTEYSFTVSDFCNSYKDSHGAWARLYYVFVPAGESVPAFDSSSITGEIETTIGRWNFFEADKDGNVPTVLISLNLGENFSGDLYVRTKDSVGNESGTVKITNGLVIYNYDTTDTIETSSNAVPKKSFDISFNSTVSGFDGIYQTEYRWIPISVDATPLEQGYITYNGQEVGSATQVGDNGESVVLNGTYKLEYKVTETRSFNTAVFEKNYIFDNLAPDISVGWNTNNELPLRIQQATIIITDVSGVSDASYKIFTADGEYVSEGVLHPEVGGDGKIAVRETVKLQPEHNGVYRIEVYATDVNGDVAVHDTSDAFAVREEKPSVISIGDDIAVSIDGVSVTPSTQYTVYLQAEETVIAASELYQSQYVVYQVSLDGMNYSAWTKYPEAMDVDGDKLFVNAEIDSPIALAEGKNTLYFKVACVEEGNTDTPSVALVSDVYTYDIIYDTTPPSFDITYSTSSPTTENVVATVTVSDANRETSLSCNNSLIDVDKESDGVYYLTIKRNVDTTVTLADAVGNEISVPVKVVCIDKDAPEIAISSEEFESGARTDATVIVRVDDYNTTTERFALVKDPTSESDVAEEAYSLFEVNQSKFTIVKTVNDGLTTYEITLRGLDGEYGIAVMSTDMLGNVAVTSPEECKVAMTDADAEIVSVTSTPEITKTTASVAITFNVPLAVLNPALATGATDEENESIAKRVATDGYVSEIVRVVSDNSEQKIYAVDEARRTYTFTFASDSAFIEGFKIDYTLYKNGEVVKNGSFISFEEDDEIELVVKMHEDYSLQTFDVADAKLQGFELNEDKSEKHVEGEEETDVYTTLVFTALRDGSTEKEVGFKSYTAEGLESDRVQDEIIHVSFFDETAPKITFTPDIGNERMTNTDVVVSAVFADGESGVALVERTVNGEKETISSLASDKVTFAENGYVTYIVTNNAGMTYEATYTVENIDKTPIEEGKHYTVSYYYEDYLGNWKLITDGKFYRAVKAVIDFEDCGKELSVTNNGTLTESILTADKTSFTFEIADTAGNVTEKTVVYENYDNDGGSIEWTLSNYNKTNQPVTAFVTISDKDNVNEIVYAEVRTADGELVLWDEEIGTERSVILPLSGNYTVIAYDAAGNRFTTLITVTNIDIVLPEITRISYSTPPSTITTRSVVVKIEEFSKANVVITGIELADNLSEYDVLYTQGSTEFRFKKSGYISVFFIDDYGNENASVISVSNIYSEPPALNAVATLAEDELSVEISFEQQLDEDGFPVDKYRSLEDLFVVYDGVTYTTNKTFTVKQNGDYTFTVFDEAGTAQIIKLSVTNIDDRAPVIKSVSWSYSYLEENGGTWEKKVCETTLEIGKDTSGKEAGYVIGPDAYKTTNEDVTVTVVTDKATAILGSDEIKNLENSMVYADNGLFTFNLVAVNGTVSSYGVDVAIIDKEAPTLEFAGANELIFIEGMTEDKDSDFAYDKAKFYDFVAYDVFDNVKTDLTSKVEIDFGDFNPDDINANVFDRTKPYTITYRVYDATGNKTELRRTVRLVGFYDTIALINGKMPNSANSITVNSNDIEISLKNFGGTVYARYASGIYTMGQMKTLGTPIKPYNGKLVAENLADGWYTVFVQTDKRDYFTITVYVNAAE